MIEFEVKLTNLNDVAKRLEQCDRVIEAEAALRKEAATDGG